MGERGPPYKIIDWDKVDKMCFIQCTAEEMASILEISSDTLVNACKREKGMKLSEYIKIKAAGGKASLRRRQYKKAVEEGNPALLIWLGKQWLGQSDKREYEVTAIPEVKSLEQAHDIARITVKPESDDRDD